MYSFDFSKSVGITQDVYFLDLLLLLSNTHLRFLHCLVLA
jgi:hypothetical protein